MGQHKPEEAEPGRCGRKIQEGFLEDPGACDPGKQSHAMALEAL